MNIYNASLRTGISSDDPEDIFLALEIEITEELDEGVRVLFSFKDGFYLDPYVLGAGTEEWVRGTLSDGTKEMYATVTEEGFKVFSPKTGVAVPVKDYFDRAYKWLTTRGETAERLAAKDDGALMKLNKAAHEASLSTTQGDKQ